MKATATVQESEMKTDLIWQDVTTDTMWLARRKRS